MEKNNILTEAFTWLFIGLLICFSVSYISTLNPNIALTIYGSLGGYGYLIFAIIEVIVALILLIKIRTLPPTIAKILYILYTALTGLTFTGIFIVYTGTSIALIFLATAIIFAIFALFGKTTKVDLSKWSTYLFIALLGIIIFEIINIFLLNSAIDLILSVITIVVFCAYVAFDIQIALNKAFLPGVQNKGIYVAFNLFLDFINIFIKLLRLFGRSRD